MVLDPPRAKQHKEAEEFKLKAQRGSRSNSSKQRSRAFLTQSQQGYKFADESNNTEEANPKLKERVCYLDWHPSEDVVAVVGKNSIFLFKQAEEKPVAKEVIKLGV